MRLKGIEKALQENCILSGFRSGGGLRVIRIQDEESKLKGYGEHPNVEDALSHANEDFLAGGRPYKEVYGVLKPHYLTGSANPTSSLDAWIARGRDFAAYVENDQFVVELQGRKQFDVPEEIMKEVIEKKNSVTWKDRGFKYESSPSTFGNNQIGVSTDVILIPKDRERAEAFSYKFMKKGSGNTFNEALEKVWEAESVEIR